MPISYIPYYPDTVEGQAILNNFARNYRILKYRDNQRVFERIQRGMPLYEAELLENVGNTNTEAPNLLLRGECLSACAYLKANNIQIDLVYIDPPFASGADYAKKVYLRKNPKVAQAIAQAEEELAFEDLKAFEEKMYGDIWNKEDYLNWMFENLTAIKSVMSDTASIYVHLDWHIGHYVKILLDEVFGEENFLNEIIWCYSIGGKGTNFFGRKHDNIFLYTNTDDHIFNGTATEVITQRKINSHMRSNVDEDGREYQEKTDKKSGKIYKYYLDEGKIPEDYWTDIEQLNREDSERSDYSTQKPEKLLERIIAASSEAGMVVADFFGGSGVTAAVAAKLGRRFIHTDVGINSIQTVRDRLVAQAADFQIHELKDGVTLYRNPQQTMDNLHRFIEGLRNEDPLPPYWEGYINDSKLGRMPVYLPNLLDHNTKILDLPMMMRIVNEAMPVLPDEIKKVIVYYIDIEEESKVLQYLKDQEQTLIAVELRDLKPILSHAILPDVVFYTQTQNEAGEYEIAIEKFLSDRLKASIDAYNVKRQQTALAKSSDSPLQLITFSENGLELIEWLSVDCENATGEWKSSVEIKIDKNSFVIHNGKKSKTFWDGKMVSSEQPLRLKVRNIAGDETIVGIV